MIVHDLKLLYARKDEISAQQRVDIDDKKFLLYCKEERSMIMGFNRNFCIKVMEDNGTWTSIVDSRELDIHTGLSELSNEKMIIQTKEGFDRFKEHLQYLYETGTEK